MLNYLKAFQKLNVSRSKGVAPHKPILLLSIVDEIERGNINENKIYITPELVGAFKSNWSVLVDSTIFSPSFALPFFHLHSEKFWHLHTIPGCTIPLTSSYSIRSFTALKNTVDYASLDETLFIELTNPEARNLYKKVLLDTWFPKSKNKYINLNNSISSYQSKLEKSILEEKPAKYKREVESADEEEIFMRGGAFKRVVPRVYNYTCCISGLQITSSQNIQMIDACHIIPFSESHDDTITNGISLCPNLHRAFDRGLIGIDETYKVIISESFRERDSNYSIIKFKGANILLPKEEKYFPSQKNLKWHRESKFLT